MTLQLKQQLKVAQQLVVTPQLKQAIKLLQLSKLELVGTIQQQLLENPFLEEGEFIAEDEIDFEGTSTEYKDKDQRISAVKVTEKELLRNAEWEEYLGIFSSSPKEYRGKEIPEEVVSFEVFTASKPTLKSHLLWQLGLSDLGEKEKKIGRVIIDYINSNGYLTASIEEIAEITKTDIKDVEQTLKVIQGFDPIGIGSRSIEECLLIQLKHLGKVDSALIALVKNHLKDLENKNYKKILGELNITIDELKGYLEIIQGLDPKPGNHYGEVEEQVYIVPDAYVFKYKDEFVIILNDEDVPNLFVNSYYVQKLSEVSNEKEKIFLQKKLKEALWFIKSLNQRQRTLYKVIESIVRFQMDFFEKGISHLKPLILKEVADDIGVHESTVSRITTNKYVSTPFGIFELKFFFSSSISTENGKEISSESVKNIIKKLIEEEDSKKPLTDQKIVELLKDKWQINIARRTVAKYREALGIPSSNKRKKLI